MDYHINNGIEICKNAMFKELPEDIEYTTKILIWNDGSFLVSLKHGTQEAYHEFSYHSDKRIVEHTKDIFQTDAVKEDAFGREYYVPNELIKYLNV